MLGTHWLVAKQLSVAVDVGAQIHHTAKVSYAFTITIGVRAGGGEGGGGGGGRAPPPPPPPPPKFWATRENLGKARF